ncbi:MAG: hypothetical protein CVU22_04735 [Betaproteobacteria bacterium HGW-Betaproteobacteria-16]|nr:MAG: hypothetical protein CVU22_04735 [Betaproteobacteria bacterium HGW-Betaproteobacteria-16]
MKIMHTIANDTIAQRHKRRYHSPELKGQIVAECQVTGASVASVALAHGINANIVHRWMREQADSLLPTPRNEFVDLNLPPPLPAASSKHGAGTRAVPQARDRYQSTEDSAPFFISRDGGHQPTRTVEKVFRRLQPGLGWCARGGHPYTRIHDQR